MDKVILYSSQVFLSENNNNPDSYIAKFVICDFGRNKNGVLIDRKHIDEWISTLKNKPLVGKIKMRNDGEYDFTGHNVKIVTKKDENGNKYQDVVFDTSAFGSFFDVAVETIDNKEYIVASCEIWKRFSQACDIIVKRIQEGTLYTSWEISVDKSRQGIIDGMATKIIELGRFMGHCLLSKYVEPAYDSSCLLEIASKNDEGTEFANALSLDFLGENVGTNNSIYKEDIMAKEMESPEVTKDIEDSELTTKNVDSEHSECKKDKEKCKSEEKEKDTKDIKEDKDKTTKVDNSETDDNVETSALTVRDLRHKIEKACFDKSGKWCWIAFFFPADFTVWCEFDGKRTELEYMVFHYTVENDVVTVDEPSIEILTTTVAEINTVLSQKDDALLKANEKIKSLEADIATLQPFKSAAEKAEAERIEIENAEKRKNLKSYALKSGFISDDECSDEKNEISTMISEMNESGIKNLIATRFMASLENSEETTTIEVSQKSEKVDVVTPNLLDGDDGVSKINPVQIFLNN